MNLSVCDSINDLDIVEDRRRLDLHNDGFLESAYSGGI